MRFYRIELHSSDVLRGTPNDGYFNIDLPDVLDVEKRDYQLAVESLLFENEHELPVLVESATISQGNSYSTRAKGASTLLLAADGDATVRVINKDVLGVRIGDPSILRGKQHNIRMRDVDGNLQGGLGDWHMVLVVYPVPE